MEKMEKIERVPESLEDARSFSDVEVVEINNEIGDWGADPYLSDSPDRAARKIMTDAERRAVIGLIHGLMYEHWRYRGQKTFLLMIVQRRREASGVTHSVNTIKSFLDNQINKRIEELKEGDGSGKNAITGSYYSQLDAIVEHAKNVKEKPEKEDTEDKTANRELIGDLKRTRKRKKYPEDRMPAKKRSKSSTEHELGVVNMLGKLADSQLQGANTLANALRARIDDGDNERLNVLEARLSLVEQDIAELRQLLVERTEETEAYRAQ